MWAALCYEPPLHTATSLVWWWIVARSAEGERQNEGDAVSALAPELLLLLSLASAP